MEENARVSDEINASFKIFNYYTLVTNKQKRNSNFRVMYNLKDWGLDMFLCYLVC